MVLDFAQAIQERHILLYLCLKIKYLNTSTCRQNATINHQREIAAAAVELPSGLNALPSAAIDNLKWTVFNLKSLTHKGTKQTDWQTDRLVDIIAAFFSK